MMPLFVRDPLGGVVTPRGGAEAVLPAHTKPYEGNIPIGMYVPAHKGCPMTWGLPEPELEYRLAVRLLHQDPPLDREVLESLVGEPRRYRDLKPLLRGRNDNVLNKALNRLREEGVIKQGVNAKTGERRYALTELGKLVVFRLHEMVPHHESIEAYERGVRASR